ncbi:MAG: protein kinase, partial [Candidatus Obscuribacterales bacterium]|nr:protein kinase [Candidatus Obscuribacterales bacterium]
MSANPRPDQPGKQELPKTYQQAKAALYPRIIDTWVVEREELIRHWRMGEGLSSRDFSIPYMGILASFSAVIEVDLPTGPVLIDVRQIESWGVSIDDALNDVLSLLDANTSGTFRTLDLAGSKVYFSDWQDGHDASRILLPALLTELPVFGDHVLFLPDAGKLIVTGLDDADGLAVGLSEIEKAQKGQDALPAMPIAIVNGVYTDFELSTDHALYNSFKRLKTAYFERIYEEQRQTLEEHHKVQLAGTFIARYSREQDSQARIYSCATLTEGCTSIVPRTDKLAFMDDDGIEAVATGPFDDVMEIVPELFDDLELYPQRYLFRGFPNKRQLATIAQKGGLAEKDSDIERTVIAAVEKKCYECKQSFPLGVDVCPNDGAQLSTSLGGSLAGLRLADRYELIEEIGRGGMGVIYSAEDTRASNSDDSIVAVKFLLNDASDNEVIRSRFMVEARAASSLNHPNVIKVRECSISEDGLPFMVMEYLSGKTLDDLLAGGEVDVSEAIELIIQVCDALGHAHRHNVVHRDIKPSNIIITKGKNEKLKAIVVDFGIAKIFTQPGQTSMRLTKTG